MPQATIEGLRAVADGVQRLVDAVKADQWDDPTPCTDWNVRRLVNHLATGNVIFTTRATGERTGPPTPEERAVDYLGDDPAASFRAVSERMLDAFSRPGFTEKTFPTPIGEQPGTGILEMRQTEMLVHGWDLARATQQKPDLPEDAAEQTLEMVRRRLSSRPRQPGGSFGAEQPAPADAPAIDRLAAFLGRPL